MKKSFLVLICSNLIFIGCSHPKARAESSPDKPSRLEDVLQQKASNSTEVVKWLRICADKCKSPDKKIAKELADGYQILFDVGQSNPDANRLTPEQKSQIVLGQTKVRGAFMQILATKDSREILETAYRELVNPQSMYASLDTEVQSAMQSTIDRLLANKDTKATGWYLKALSIPPSAENILDVLEAYKKCLDVSPDDKGCLSAYQDLTKFYERPRCRDKYFSVNLQFFGAQTKKDKTHNKKLSLYGKDYYLATRPTLGANDMLESTLENMGPDQWEIWFSLKTFSGNKLLKFTDEGMAKHWSLLMEYNGKVLSEAPVMQKIKEGQFRMQFANPVLAKEAFEKICTEVTPDRIPENLRLTPINK